MMGGDHEYPMQPERYRIPGDALQLALYRLEEAQARIQELEREVERLNNDVDDLCIEAAKISRKYGAVQPNGDGVYHSAIYWMRCFDSSQAERCRLNVKVQELENDRDNWRAKAGG